MSTGHSITIDLDDDLDRHRYRCPRGHAYWVPTNFHFWCYSCASSSWEVDPEFHELHDLKNDETIPRNRITFEQLSMGGTG